MSPLKSRPLTRHRSVLSEPSPSSSPPLSELNTVHRRPAAHRPVPLSRVTPAPCGRTPASPSRCRHHRRLQETAAAGPGPGQPRLGHSAGRLQIDAGPAAGTSGSVSTASGQATSRHGVTTARYGALHRASYVIPRRVMSLCNDICRSTSIYVILHRYVSLYIALCHSGLFCVDMPLYIN